MSASSIVLLSYANVNEPATGGARRIDALLSALGKDAVLCQPGAPHPVYETITLPVHLGKRRAGFNPAIFNYRIPSNKRIVRKALDERRPGLVVLASMWAASALDRRRPLPVLLDTHDVNTTAIRERFGRHSLISAIVKSCEGRTVRAVTRLAVCSAVDRAQFMDLHRVEPARIAIIPNGVVVSDFDGSHGRRLPQDLERELEDATVLLHTGSTNYQPNAVAARFLATRVMPELERMKAGRFRLVLTGGGKKVARKHPAIYEAGRLSDEELKAVIARADICLAPTMSGSGTRLKVLEYMAAGKAIVSTAKGAEGIDCEADRNIVIAGADRFAAEIMELADDEAKRDQLGMAARELAKRKYDWDACIKPLWREVVREITSR